MNPTKETAQWVGYISRKKWLSRSKYSCRLVGCGVDKINFETFTSCTLKCPYVVEDLKLWELDKAQKGNYVPKIIVENNLVEYFNQGFNSPDSQLYSATL